MATLSFSQWKEAGELACLAALLAGSNPDGTPLDRGILFAAVNATADGDNTVVAAVSGKKIRVINYTLSATAAGACTVTSGAGGATLAKFQFAANGGAVFEGNVDSPAFETASGAALVFNNAVGQDILGHIAYLTY